MTLFESWSEFCLWSLLGAVLFPAIGLGLSAMSGGRRTSGRPQGPRPGDKNIKRKAKQ